MKVFLSWSGDQSKLAAKAIHEWLPTVIQTVQPYMSAETINKGERWSLDLSKQLECTHFGVNCVTPDNVAAPWVLFEAGALSKAIDKARVSPLLFGLASSDFTDSPLLQFQHTVFKKEDFGKLLHSLNAAAPDTEKLTKEVLDRSFARAWAELEQEIAKIDFATPKRSGKSKHEKPAEEKIEQVLDELLSIARSQMKLLRSPEDMLPAGYLRKVLDDMVGPNPWRERLRSLRPDWENINAVTEQITEALAVAGPLEADAKLQIQRTVMYLNNIIGSLRNRLYGQERDYAEELRRFIHLSSYNADSGADVNKVVEILRQALKKAEQQRS